MRSNVVGIIAGARGTGKTDLLKNHIIMASPFKKKLVVDTLDSPVWHTMKTFDHPEWDLIDIPILDVDMLEKWKGGLYRMFSANTDLMMEQIQLNLRNGLLIFEDATKHIGSKLTKPMRHFILDSKQTNIDVFLVFHSLSQVPPDLIRCADTLTLFKTNEGTPSTNKYPFPQIPEMMKYVRNSSNHYEHVTIRLN